MSFCTKLNKNVIVAIAFVCLSPSVVTAIEYDWRNFPAKFMAKPSKARDLCDREAADPDDLQKRPGVKGERFTNIEVDPAVDSCKRALTEAPHDPLLNFQYGRALHSKVFFRLDDKSASEALTYYKKAADSGHRHSLLLIGFMFESGHGVQESFNTALKMYQSAVDVDYAPALLPITCLYKYRMQSRFNGFAPGQMQRAIARFENAALNGSLQATAALVNAHTDGCLRGARHDDGSPVSRWSARKWLTLAANRGNAQAMAQLASMLMDSEAGSVDEVVADTDEALRWANMAVKLGHDGAMNVLGAMYWEGTRQIWAKSGGVPMDKDLAVKWWRKAASLGNEDAKSNLEMANEYFSGAHFKVEKSFCEKNPEKRMCGGWNPN
ncbi:tetratricopeptide repeat protein [Rhodoferax sp.]|uniref:tetratricopeptide repeat protein n=1 Tax=Rhodoferax sp. TaxID=50421 RepID=UPI0037838D90